MGKFKHHSLFTSEKSKQSYLFPNVCFNCRKVFRRTKSDQPHKCPDCGKLMFALSRKFKAPKKEDHDAWQVVEFIIHAGFSYQSIHLQNGSFAKYLKTMKEAELFVQTYGKNNFKSPSNQQIHPTANPCRCAHPPLFRSTSSATLPSIVPLWFAAGDQYVGRKSIVLKSRIKRR